MRAQRQPTLCNKTLLRNAPDKMLPTDLSDDAWRSLFTWADSCERHQAPPEAFHEGPLLGAILLGKVQETVKVDLRVMLVTTIQGFKVRTPFVWSIWRSNSIYWKSSVCWSLFQTLKVSLDGKWTPSIFQWFKDVLCQFEAQSPLS